MYQVDPLKNIPTQNLPTMYDLPSEDPQEPGLPDEFHEFQPQLLRETFRSSVFPPTEIFIGTDLNLYYDFKHPQWYKRPDWFMVLGVPRALHQSDLRLSYVFWQEALPPYLVVELLSPGTEAEDLGQTLREVNQPPTKWEVYERRLRVPYYVVFDRYTNHFRVFQLVGYVYEELDLPNQRLWLADAQIGIGLWQGTYADAEGNWLRCYDASGNWIPTLAESGELQRQRAEQESQRAEQESQRAEQESQRAEQESQRADQESQRAERLAARLRELGVDPDSL